MTAGIPPLGPVQQAVLAALAEHGPMTAARLGEHLGRNPVSIHQSVRTLRDRGLVTVAEYQRRAGTAAGVYAITTAGREALEAAKEAAS